MTQREAMQFDVVIVGAGPAGLSASIRLKQLAPELSICVLDKGSEPGAHILSGAVIDPRALAELIPDFAESGAPLHTRASTDRFVFLTRQRAIGLPVPPPMQNHGNFIVSLGDVTRWLATQAEAAGVEIYAGFAAAELLIEDGQVVGVATGDMGLGRDGAPGANHQPGIELRAPYTLFAEGCRGSLSKQVMRRFDLCRDSQPQTHGLGIKELWEVPADRHQPGLVLHSLGWPLDAATYGGGFLYHFGNNLISIGLVVGLDYRNPFLSPFAEMQRFKHHPSIGAHLAGGRRIAYGARALIEGGLQSLPRLTFPGGALVGDAAGFLNAPRIKGTHAAMKSGMLAAEAVADAFAAGRPAEPLGYSERFRASWLHEELHRARNIRPGFAKFGLYGGLAHAAIDHYLLRGRAPWTLGHHPDHESLIPAAGAPPIAYPRPDGVLSFDLNSSVFLSNTNHAEDQPAHLRLRDPALWQSVNQALYASPESRYCPAGVYESIAEPDGEHRLQINAQNCVHCKTCDIKDPRQNIDWTTPEGGGGPNYPGGM